MGGEKQLRPSFFDFELSLRPRNESATLQSARPARMRRATIALVAAPKFFSPFSAPSASAARMEPAPPPAPLRGFDFFRAMGSPTTICAPMVDASELAFRMLVRRYGAQLAYTPMLHSGQALKARTYLRDNFTTCPGDRPLIAQFCGNDPATLLEAARLVQDRVDAVDLNLGCPQGIARKGHYGAFLLEETDLLVRIVSTLSAGLRVPVTCKIRRLPCDERTIALVLALQGAGCSLITIHGRQRDNMKNTITAVDWDIIRLIKAHPAVTIPVVANGGIADAADVQACLSYTGADGVMSSEALLENPALFSGRRIRATDLAREYLALAMEHSAELGCAKGHLMKILFGVLSSAPFHDLRAALAGPKRSLEDFQPVLDEIIQRYEGLSCRVAGGPRRSLAGAGATVSAAAAAAAAATSAVAAERAQDAGAGILASDRTGSGTGGAAESSESAPLPTATSDEAVQQRVETWSAMRSRDPTAGLSHPGYLSDFGLPGAWYMRHRRDVTFSDTSSAARVVAAEAQSDTEKSDEHSRTAKRPRLEGQPAT